MDNLLKPGVGQKDIAKNLFDIWYQIFSNSYLQRSKSFALKLKSSAKNSDSQAEFDAANEKFQYLYHSLKDCSDLNRVIEGCYENYIFLKFVDPLFTKAIDCLEWLAFSDMLDRQRWSDPGSSWHSGYVPLTPIAFHFHSAKVQPHSNLKINFPKMFPEVPCSIYSNSPFLQQLRMKITNQKSLLKTFLSESHPHVAMFYTQDSVLEDLASLFLTIVDKPSIRPVNIKLLNPTQAQEYNNLIRILKSYRINFVKNPHAERDDDYHLEPYVLHFFYLFLDLLINWQ
jgi:hypothetical protein